MKTIAKRLRKKGQPESTEWVVANARLKHGDKFDYSKTQYRGISHKVTIICPIHGEFEITASQHLRTKYGCPQCSGKVRKTTNAFIEKSKAKWGDRLDYAKTKYFNAYTPVILTCKIHGDYETKPNSHMKNFGCPGCATAILSQRSRKDICGIAHNDGNIQECKDRIFLIWHGMIKRTCDRSVKATQKCYESATVCEEWLNYSSFKQWVESDDSGYQDGFELDKDILGNGADLYSPLTCCFVHPRINKLLIWRKGRNNGLPLGVSRCKDRYSAYCSHLTKIHNLGTFDTPEEAFQAYKKDKEAYIKQVAEDYYARGLMHVRVYTALMKYKVKP